MNRRRADTVVGLLVAAVLVVGAVLSWQAYQQQRVFEAMGSMMGTVHGTNPLWYVFGTLLASAVVAGLYLVVRGDLPTTAASGRPPTEPPGSATGEITDSPEEDSPPGRTSLLEGPPRPRVLDLLPEDERRILEPVLTSPGITQIELRDRSDFSKSKVSQTVSELEKRGLLYRERQGRTYRIYPGDELVQNQK